MAKAPIHVDSHARTGDPTIASREVEALSRRFDKRERRKLHVVWALVALMAGIPICLAIDLITWRLGGALAYIDPPGVGVPLLTVLPGFLATLMLLRLSNRLQLWPLAIVIAMSAGALDSSFRYLRDTAVSGPVRMATYAIDRVELKNSSRRGLGLSWDKFRPRARLFDARGRSWTLNGSQEFIAPLLGHECITLRMSGADDHYQFTEGTPTMVETPYIDSTTGQRHLSRCFTKTSHATLEST